VSGEAIPPELLTDVLRRARARGATEADGFLIEEQHFSASVRLGQVDTVKHSREQRLSLRVFAGKASAAASTSDLSRASLERVVDEATLAALTLGGPAPAAMGRAVERSRETLERDRGWLDTTCQALGAARDLLRERSAAL